MAEEKGKRRWLKRLRITYRLVVMNDDTFEERLSWRLTPLRMLVLIGSISIVMTVLVTSVVAFTPLREYIPGYSNSFDDQRRLIRLNRSLDSLTKAAQASDAYLKNLTTILNGDDKPEKPANPRDTSKNYTGVKFQRTKEDSILRTDIETQNKSYALTLGNTQRTGISGYFFFTPVKGTVTSTFNTAEDHYGVDIAAPENEAITATLDGTIIFAGWTSEAGYMVQIQHPNNLISVYKHNSAILKKSGEYVKAGEAIAIIGNTGEQKGGTHLHFELWYNGSPVDPEDYLAL